MYNDHVRIASHFFCHFSLLSSSDHMSCFCLCINIRCHGTWIIRSAFFLIHVPCNVCVEILIIVTVASSRWYPCPCSLSSLSKWVDTSMNAFNKCVPSKSTDNSCTALQHVQEVFLVIGQLLVCHHSSHFVVHKLSLNTIISHINWAIPPKTIF